MAVDPRLRTSKLKPYKNTGLFADHFLDEKLPGEKRWLDVLADPKIADIFSDLKTLYEKNEPALPGMNEAQTEADFIRPVLEKILGFAWTPQTTTKGLTGRLVPDYALFADEATKKQNTAAVRDGNYANVLAIADAKFWDRPLDKKIADSRDTLTNQNPSFQISSYLIATKVKWAILTNGRLWRLYSLDHSDTMGEFFQVDIVQLLETGSLNDWLYFYLFFRKDAFVAAPAPSFIEQITKESIDYGAALEDSLKKKIFEDIFVFLAKGFFDWRRKSGLPEETPETLKEIFNGTLILLYRLLFILYAESRDLLPVRELHGYHTKSLDKVKHEIKEDIESTKKLSEVSTDYWDDLANLFHIIDVGDPALNMPKYNGGLFASNHEFLAVNKLADAYLAKALYFLTSYQDNTTGNWVFIDYKSLGVRQLGSIYEGLLEFHVNVADEELAVVKEKGKEKYVPVGHLVKGKKDIGPRVKPGELYLENTKAERKATGSYYTPDYIVQYIVENTVGPLVDDLEQAFEEQITKLKSDSRYRTKSAGWKTLRLKKFDPAVKALELKICDPAMGSGHFLVATVNYIAKRISKILAERSGRPIFGKEIYESPLYAQIEDIRTGILSEMDRQGVTIDKEKLEDDKVIIRRMVMKRCIFGVDLNYLAVELAKLSLWLNSFTVGAPLSFLDHHLRWGNSLIGSTIEEAKREMEASLFGSRFTGLISATDAMIRVGELTDSTFAELQESHQQYLQAVELLQPYKTVLDIWTSQFFGNDGAKDLIDQGRVDPDNLEQSLKQLSKADAVIAGRAEELKNTKRFFHWELEFPEVFFDRHATQSNPGFDVVIGNPPYIRIQTLNASVPEDIKFLGGRYKSATGSYDIYLLFIERGHALLKSAGRFAYIMPNKFWLLDFGKGLRGMLAENRGLAKLVDFGDNQVFRGQTTYTCVLVLSGQGQEQAVYIKIPAASNVATDMPQWLANEQELPAVTIANAELSEAPWGLAAAREKFLMDKLDAQSNPLAEICENIIVGLQTSADPIYILRDLGPDNGRRRVFSTASREVFELESDLLKPLVSGEDVDRYRYPQTNKLLLFPYRLTDGGAELVGADDFQRLFPRTWNYLKEHERALRARERGKMDHERWYAYVYPKNLDKHERPKLGSARLADRLRFILDLQGQVYLDNVDVNGVLLADKNIAGGYLATLLNSRLIDWRFKQTSVRFRGSYYSANKQFIAPLPIRYISFITASAVRTERLAHAEALYADYLKSSDSSAILKFSIELLEKKHVPDTELAKKHNLDPLNKDFQIPQGALWEQSDVIHDFLAFLGEQMVAMNKEKQEETNGFLTDFQRTVGAGVDDLLNKTLVKDYHRHSFDELLAVLEKNSNKLKGFNPKARSDRELLEAEFNKSVGTLTPLKTKILATDDLIDQIVYKLYGLTEEELAVVEGKGA